LSLGPQAYADVRDAGLLDQPGREQNWKQFAIRSAKNQSGNIAGLLSGMGASVVAASATSLPAVVAVVIVVGVGYVGQAVFNAFGANDAAEEAVRRLVE